MSNTPHQKSPKLPGGKSDGEYLGARGSTNKFQAQWLEHPASDRQPQRKDWLSEGGGTRKELVPSSMQHHPPLFLRGLLGLKGEQQQQQLRMLIVLQQQ